MPNLETAYRQAQELPAENQARVRDAMIDTMADMAFQKRVETDQAFKAELDASLHAASDQARAVGTKPIEGLQLEIETYIDQLHG